MIPTRDIARLLRYGERFGAYKIDVRMLSLHLHARSGSLAVFDPGVPSTWHIFDRPIGSGAYRVMLSVARPDDSDSAGGNRSKAGAKAVRERLAAVVIHVGRPPIAKWTVAHFRGQAVPAPRVIDPRSPASEPGSPRVIDPRSPASEPGSPRVIDPRSPASEPGSSAGALPRTVTTTGWVALLDADGGAPGVLALPSATDVTPVEVPLTDGRHALALPCETGAFGAYWALDAVDKPICLVIDFDIFPEKAWKT
jgi:hypothetical protein